MSAGIDHFKTIRWEVWAGLAVLILSIIGLALLPSQVAEPKLSGRSIAFPPSAFPAISLLVLAATAIGMILNGWRTEEPDTGLPGGTMRPRALYAFVIFLGYAILIEGIGMMTASVIVVPVMAYFLGNRSFAGIAAMTLLIPTFVWLFFGKFLKIYLPSGSWTG